VPRLRERVDKGDSGGEGEVQGVIGWCARRPRHVLCIPEIIKGGVEQALGSGVL